MSTFVMGARAPRRGNAFSRRLGRLVLWLMGWKVVGEVPDYPHMVMVGAPHTSNMDGVIGITTLTAIGLKASVMIKDTAFKGAMGPILRWFGAIPINRRSPKGVVEQSIEAIKTHPQMALLIAVEGTRSAAADFKRGYHRIALGAGVPIVGATIHYPKKIVRIGKVVWPTEDYAANESELLDFFVAHGAPRHSERLSKPLCERTGQTWQPAEDD